MLTHKDKLYIAWCVNEIVGTCFLIMFLTLAFVTGRAVMLIAAIIPLGFIVLSHIILKKYHGIC
jgi:hypothetical protein